MKTGALVSVVLLGIAISGCDNREEELQGKITSLQSVSDSLGRAIADRDIYFDEVLRAINQVHGSLEHVREQEASITRAAGEAEGRFSATNEQTRIRLMAQIAGIDSTLAANRKRINSLRARVRSLNKDYTALDETLSNLRRMIEERELTIAMLEERVTGLEGALVEKSREIAQRDSIIDAQVNRINEVYYIAGSRNELEEKGIIRNEGGFPFGWFGSTTVMASGVDQGLFTTLDVTSASMITIEGEVNEIVPQRSASYFALNAVDETNTSLNIIDPEKFWQEKYLVIITDQ